ncbi:trigger factor [Patescibacteria group bacterium]|nr:trigger factor [Patescibacteria group bacterium]
MKTSLETKPASIVILTIELDLTEWQEALGIAGKAIAQNVAIKGFRAGMAPLDLVISEVGEAKVLSEAAELCVNKFYALAVVENKLIPVVPPKVTIEKLALDKPIIFKAEITVLPETTLGDYKKIKVEKQEIKIDEEQVAKTLEGLRRRGAKFNPVERVTQAGDWVEIDFEGKLDGVVFEGGVSKNHPLIIGDGVFLPDFEEGLIGIAAGGEKTFEVKFPTDYHQKNLADKTVQFSVKIHKVKEVIMPEIDDELAKGLGQFNSLAELKADIDKWMLEDARKKEETRQQEVAMQELLKIAKVEVPEVLVEQELGSMMEDMKNELSHQKIELTDYLKKNNLTEEKLRIDWKEAAAMRAKAGLVLDAFKKAEHIEATDEEVEKDIDRLKKTYPDKEKELDEKYKSGLERARLKNLLSGQKALKELWQIATN